MWTYPPGEPAEVPALVLAYVGDAVFELYVRLFLINKSMGKVKELHSKAAQLVKAASQAAYFHRLDPLLSEEERGVARRGRNAKSGHVPKNAEVTDYRLSTGFECLLGYLFLHQREARIQELLEFLLQDEIET